MSEIKAYISQINLQHGTTTVENRKPTSVRLIYSMEQQQWRTGRLQNKKTTE